MTMTIILVAALFIAHDFGDGILTQHGADGVAGVYHRKAAYLFINAFLNAAFIAIIMRF